MTEQGKQAASLRLSPEHLGPLEIRIAITDERASVWFGAAHADTRAAIEHALPRLREMFEAQGMSLADAGVYEQAPREQPELTRQSNLGAGESKEAEGQGVQVRVNLGLIDAYA
jgi:flagellar hook-length control protein FliK